MQTPVDSYMQQSTHVVQILLKEEKQSLPHSLSLAPQPSLGLGLLHNILPLKMAEFLGGFPIIFFFTG
jgi:hypothetical protein